MKKRDQPKKPKIKRELSRILKLSKMKTKR